MKWYENLHNFVRDIKKLFFRPNTSRVITRRRVRGGGREWEKKQIYIRHETNE